MTRFIQAPNPISDIRSVKGLSKIILSYDRGILTLTEFWGKIRISLFNAEDGIRPLDSLPSEHQALLRAIYRNSLRLFRNRTDFPDWLPESLSYFGIADWCEASW